MWHSISRNSGTVYSSGQYLLQVEMTCSPGRSVEADKAPTLEDTIQDGGREILVMYMRGLDAAMGAGAGSGKWDEPDPNRKPKPCKEATPSSGSGVAKDPGRY